jgi:hypothetical protein
VTEIVLSTLVMPGEIVPVCNGCTETLYRVGLLRKIAERPINPRQLQFTHAVFTLDYGVTLADCQGVVPGHIGNAGEAWGKLPRGYGGAP